MIDRTRIERLISGDAKPDDVGEFALVRAYIRALAGQTLMNVCIDMGVEMMYYKDTDYEMFLYGYAIGQKDYLDKINGLDLSKVTKNDDEQSH